MPDATTETPSEADPAPPSLKQRLGAAAFGIVARSFAVAPEWLAYGIADMLAPILRIMTHRRERRVEPKGRGMVRNQRIAFRDSWTEEWSREHIRRWARHTTHLFVDFCRMTRWTPDNLERFVDTAEFESLRDLLREGNGVVSASGHMGHWELCGHVAALMGMPTSVVARPLKNPALDVVVNRIRTSGGQEVLAKWGVLWALARVIKRGAMIGIAADENSEVQPTFAPFLGTLAATSSTAALLASRTGAPIAVTSCNRVGRGRFKVHVWDVIRVEKKRSVDFAAVTARVSDALSRAILAYPEQWLWGSRRFKTRPDGEQPGPDGLPPRAPLAESPNAPELTSVDR